MDPNVMLELYKETGAVRRDFNDRMDNSLKYFTTIFSALISVSVSARLLSPRIDSIPTWALVLLPASAFFISLVGLFESRRLYNRYMVTITTLNKVENLLGLHETFDRGKLYYPEDLYVLPKRFVEREPNYVTSEKFVEAIMSLRVPKASEKQNDDGAWQKLVRMWHGNFRYVSLVTVLFTGYMVISVVLGFVLR